MLADLSLILFLATASALSDELDRGAADPATRPDEQTDYLSDNNAAASYYLLNGNAPLFTDWLTEQPRDPREQLTIRADYVTTRQGEAIEQVQVLSASASSAGFAPRIIIEPATQMRISASFAFDAGQLSSGDMARLLLNTDPDPGDRSPSTGE